MARRIIIETDLTCEHGVTGRNHLVTTNERKRDGSAVVIECVAGTEVRVLDPGDLIRALRKIGCGSGDTCWDPDAENWCQDIHKSWFAVEVEKELLDVALAGGVSNDPLS